MEDGDVVGTGRCSQGRLVSQLCRMVFHGMVMRHKTLVSATT